MKYIEVTLPTPHGPEYAFGINDFDSMAVRLVCQLTREQILAKLDAAYEESRAYRIEGVSVTPDQLTYGRVRD